MFETLFPLGVSHYLLGGLFVGLGIAFVFIMTGKVAGASTIFTSTWSYLLKGSWFHRSEFIETRDWRLLLALGLIMGGALWVILLNSGQNVLTEISWWRILLGGLLVGWGTRLSGGCASGHGICGNASLSKDSLVATLTFLLIGISVALLTSNFF